ncbi:XdhC family protein [Fuchsiella alkaliacetigena]|uniref:XdhC family protein n=1 Tax=Fuchsiella alkaliacetigena TaxID=957042 RepID=UPI00200AF931|nr:XdhC family protein [Fuchsiella alkaliacetigena]MCK8825484.1 XdhC family protein [Fuchsiella alkaliacetigena]
MSEEVIELLANYQGEFDSLALATIIESSGSTPRKAGAKMVVFPDGRSEGTIGGGCGEAEIRQQALSLLSKEGGPVLYTLDMTNDVAAAEGMICGGKMEVFIERIAFNN